MPTTTKELKAQDLILELRSNVHQLDSVRQGSSDSLPCDISLSDLVQEKYGLSLEDYYRTLGINTQRDTMQNVFTMPDQNIRWIVPEIIRQAIVTGMREAPFYPTIISADTPINGLSAIMPFVNMSDAAPARVNEGETIPLGDVSFGQKTVTLFKIGRGFKLTDEVKNFVSLDVLAIFIRDFGVKLGYALDTLAVDTLINGNDGSGAESAPVIGVGDTTQGITYRDMLRIWIRSSRLGRNFRTMIGGEDAALDILDLPEFKNRQSGTPMATLNLKTPVPNSADFYIHPGIPADSVLMVDPRSALIKLTAKQLMIESERIVSNQTEGVYASLITGFSKMWLDASVILDGTKDFATNGFPDFFNIDPFLTVDIK